MRAGCQPSTAPQNRIWRDIGINLSVFIELKLAAVIVAAYKELDKGKYIVSLHARESIDFLGWADRLWVYDPNYSNERRYLAAIMPNTA